MSEKPHNEIAEGQAGRARPRSLRPVDWPHSDRNAWEAACAPAGRLRRGGAAAHLAQITRDDLERRYGYFLDYLVRACLLDPTGEAAAHLTPALIDGFVAELRQRVRSVTLAQTIHKLRRMAELLTGRDLEWLRDLERDLAFDAVPQSRAGQLVDGPRLLKAGLILIKEGEVGARLAPLRRARLIRDGLMIAILSLCPIRLKNLAALKVGTSFRHEAGAWWIALDRRTTKSKRPDERKLPEILQGCIDLYLHCARPVLMREPGFWPRFDRSANVAMRHGALWVDSNLGRPMSYSGVEEAVAEATRRTLGVKLRPHMFRSCAATTAYIRAGENPHLASALLQHTDTRVTQKHYNRATNAQAAQVYAELVLSDMMMD